MAIIPRYIGVVQNPDVGTSSLVEKAAAFNYPHAEWYDRILKTTIAGMDIGYLETGNEKYAQVGEVLSGAKTVLSITRGTSMLIKVCSGSLTHEYRAVPCRNNGGDGVVECDEEHADVIAEGHNHRLITTMNVVKRRDWLDIALDVVLMVARFLNPLLWLDRIKAIDLGHHRDWIGKTVGCAFTAVTCISFIQSIKDLGNDVSLAARRPHFDQERLRKRWADLLSNFVDVLSIPYDSGWTFSSSKGGALATAICGLASGFIWLAKEAKYR
jgi:hypothetical protein